MLALFDCRDAFAGALEELAVRDPRIVAVVNDSVGSTRLARFARQFPARLVNVGIAEQNMVGIGAGLEDYANGVAYVGWSEFDDVGSSQTGRRSERQSQDARTHSHIFDSSRVRFLQARIATAAVRAGADLVQVFLLLIEERLDLLDQVRCLELFLTHLNGRHAKYFRHVPSLL